MRSAIRSVLRSCIRSAIVRNGFNPASLFSSGQDGLWYDFNPSWTYEDTSRTDPVELGDGIAGITDRSGNGCHASQSTSTARPKVWNRYNRVQYSEDLTQTSYWSHNLLTVNSNATTAPDGTLTADEVVENNGGAIFRLGNTIPTIAGETVTVTVRLKRSNADWVRIIVGDNTSFTNATRAWFNLATGAVGGTSNSGTGWSVLSRSLVANEQGFYTATLKFVSPATGLFLALVTASADLSTTRADVGSGAGIGTKFYAWGIDVRNSACDHLDYQRVVSSPWALGTRTTDYDTDATKFPYYAAFDLADDVEAATIPAITGQIVFAGTWGIWVDTFTHAGGAFEIGTKSGLVSTYTGGADGLLNIVGNPIGCIIREGNFATAELENIKRYYYSLGAPGYFTLGSELVTNGGFDSDTVWAKGTGWAIGSGVATKTPGVQSDLNQVLTAVSSKPHIIGASVVRSAGTLNIYLRGALFKSASSSSLIKSVGISGTLNSKIEFLGLTSFDGSIDSVSVREITLVPKP